MKKLLFLLLAILLTSCEVGKTDDQQRIEEYDCMSSAYFRKYNGEIDKYLDHVYGYLNDQHEANPDSLNSYWSKAEEYFEKYQTYYKMADSLRFPTPCNETAD